MIGKVKAIEVGRPLDLRKKPDQKVFRERVVADVMAVLQKHVDDCRPSRAVQYGMLLDLRAAISDINHIHPSILKNEAKGG